MTYTCSTTVTIVPPSTTVNLNYDMSTQSGTTNYAVPEFTLSPAGSTGTITYTDVTTPTVTGVTFDTLSRTYNWVSVTTPGTYTLNIQGSLPGSMSVTKSYTLSITQSYQVVPSSVSN